jgi:hypothetical protein
MYTHIYNVVRNCSHLDESVHFGSVEATEDCAPGLTPKQYTNNINQQGYDTMKEN